MECSKHRWVFIRHCIFRKSPFIDTSLGKWSYYISRSAIILALALKSNEIQITVDLHKHTNTERKSKLLRVSFDATMISFQFMRFQCWLLLLLRANLMNIVAMLMHLLHINVKSFLLSCFCCCCSDYWWNVARSLLVLLLSRCSWIDGFLSCNNYAFKLLVDICLSDPFFSFSYSVFCRSLWVIVWTYFHPHLVSSLTNRIINKWFNMETEYFWPLNAARVIKSQ